MNAAERSLRTFGWVTPLARIHFWAPVFFLYLNERFTIEQVLQLEAVYYFSVFALEVPSGYWSDRFGRVRTLRIAALAAVVSYALFLFGRDEFLLIGLAEVALAFTWSFRSGTEAAFHYDTLESLGRAEEFGAREARLASRGFALAASGAVVGGMLGSQSLGWPYAAGALVAIVVLGGCLTLREPPRSHEVAERIDFFGQLGDCFSRMRDPLLLWIFAAYVLKTTTEHVPYEFGQPYVAAVFGESTGERVRTPLVAGALVAGWQVVGAFAARYALTIQARLGVTGSLLALAVLQALLITALALWIHPVIAGLLVLRQVQAAVGNVIINATVTPRIPQLQRATYLSIHSLAGRLGYALVLLGLGTLAQGVDPVADMQRMLVVSAWLAGAGALVLAALRGRARGSEGNYS